MFSLTDQDTSIYIFVNIFFLSCIKVRNGLFLLCKHVERWLNNSYKKLFFALFLFNISPFIFCMSPPSEIIIIANNSSSIIYFAFNIKQYGPLDYYEDDFFIGTIRPRNAVREQKEYLLEPGNYLMLIQFRTNLLIGIIQKFKSYIENFIVYDIDRKIILTLDDMQEGTIIVYDYLDNSIIEKNEREGTIKIEFFGKPDVYLSNVDYTIEITDDLILKGREKYKQLE